MANRCDNCGRGSDYGHNVSHAKNRTKTKRKPNLHNAKVLVNGELVKKRLCTRCLRAAKRPDWKEVVEKKIVKNGSEIKQKKDKNEELDEEAK